MKRSDKKFILDNTEQAIIESKVHATENVHLMVVPVHMNGCHWGLVVVDFLNARLLFDDGMKWQPRRSLLAEEQQLLDITQRLRLNGMSLSSTFWSQKSNFERFGMPVQILKFVKQLTGQAKVTTKPASLSQNGSRTTKF